MFPCRRNPISTLLLLLLLCWPSPAFADDDPGETRRRLEEIERRIEQTARDLGEKRTRAGSLAGDLQRVEQEQKRLQERIAALQREAATLESRQKEKAAEVKALQEQSSRTEQLVRRRLAALYKGGEMGPLRMLFAAVSPARLAEDHDYLGRVVRRDRELLDGYRRQLVELEQAQAELARLQRQRRDSLGRLQQERQELQRAARLKEKLLAQLRREEVALAGELAELRERAQRLGALLKRLESEKAREYTQKDGPFGRQKGRLPWPIQGGVRVAFGTSRHPELGTLHDSQGIEIATEAGQPVTAVWPGRVIFADGFKGFGNLLILDHGDGYYTLYAQASRLTRRVGDQVGGGEVVALTGFEGARGLYFEVRHHGVPQNPTAWLVPR